MRVIKHKTLGSVGICAIGGGYMKRKPCEACWRVLYYSVFSNGLRNGPKARPPRFHGGCDTFNETTFEQDTARYRRQLDEVEALRDKKPKVYTEKEVKAWVSQSVRRKRRRLVKRAAGLVEATAPMNMVELEKEKKRKRPHTGNSVLAAIMSK